MDGMMDQLILVDHRDSAIGQVSKKECHTGDGRLHRAFSVFLFDADGNFLLQRRSARKHLWPGFWSNACCSHPRWGENTETAVNRRLLEELKVATQVERLFSFEYEARYQDIGIEHEFCSVWRGETSPDMVEPNRSEIDEIRWIPSAALSDAINAEPETFTPWFRMEWERYCRDYGC